MKIIFRTTAVAALILTTSCGKDTANAIADIFDEEVEQLENTVLDVETISDNVLIEGGTKMEGTPPTPNGAISLDISDSGKTAFLGEGFDVSLNSDTELSGAYIQFKSKDGNTSDAYYDVNLETNNINTSDKSLRRRRVAKINRFSSTSKTDDTVLDVDFNANIEPGEFCYIICVYDVQGNISLPQEVCVTVEAWGGNSDLIALWGLTKDSETYNGVESTSLIGEEECGEVSTFGCIEDGEYMAAYFCDTLESFEIEFKEDGTYRFESNDSGKSLNTDSSYDACEAIYEDNQGDYSSEGQWAYVADENRLILVEYSYSESYQGESYSGTYEPGEAELLFDGLVEFEAATMIITEEGPDYIDKYYFEK